MSSFSKEDLEKKLSELRNSKESIQTLSLWIIHYRRFSQVIVSVWDTELRKAESSRKLVFLLLANDVILNSQRKGPEFVKGFAPIIVDAFKHACEVSDICRTELRKVILIWKKKAVYNRVILEELKMILYGEKKPKKRRFSEVKQDHDDTSASRPPKAPLQSKDLACVIRETENTASGDASVHQMTDSLPAEINIMSYLGRIGDKESGHQLSKLLFNACMLLADGAGRLAAETDDRKDLIQMLSNYLQRQEEEIEEKEHQLEMYKEKLERAKELQNELCSRFK
ncbi:regulation of nuclear pre-mRNA domain-containing protein 1A-like [Spea bombifrons]|uniref:regulation of nuclear pre-mRNA domain-containing protein 1A-like n=1 Tax=Spea bombifrons TaxID=233779 RepID=UPI002348F88F|nr:regulation of nuclear pre-mRNA domain-containing protein 1A-like [Spea bombifrons]